MKSLEDRVAALENLIGSGAAWVVTGGGVGGIATSSTGAVLPPQRKVTETVIAMARDGDGEPFESLLDCGNGRRLVPASGRVLMPNGVTYYLDPTVFRYVECGKDGGATVTPDAGMTIRFMRATPIRVGTPEGR